MKNNKVQKKLTFVLTMVEKGANIQMVQIFEQERRIKWHSIMTN